MGYISWSYVLKQIASIPFGMIISGPTTLYLFFIMFGSNTRPFSPPYIWTYLGVIILGIAVGGLLAARGHYGMGIGFAIYPLYWVVKYVVGVEIETVLDLEYVIVYAGIGSVALLLLPSGVARKNGQV